MCLIIAAPHKKRIPNSVLEAAASSNRDGAGVAWYDKSKKKICFKKQLDLAGVIATLDGEASGKSYAVHFRIATVGGAVPELTHPFTIENNPATDATGESESVLFQNGTCSDWKDALLKATLGSGLKLPPPPWSDSRAVALLCHIHGKHILSLVDNHSRYLVFDATEPDNRRMMLWGDWHDHEGFKFSHKGSPVFTAPVVRTVVTTPTTGANNPNTTNSSYLSRETSRTPTTGTTTGSATDSARRYIPKEGYDAFRKFSTTGTPLVAANENPVSLD